MPRIRSIKPEFQKSPSMGRISREARLTFILLWPEADDAGRLRGSSRMLASLLFPYDDDAPQLIDGWLSELTAQLCIDRYEVDGEQFIQIRNWLKHQKIDHPSKSAIPAFDEGSRNLARTREDSRLEGIGEEGIGRDQGPGLEGTKDTAIAVGLAAVPASAPRKTRAKTPPETAPVWEAYSGAFEVRYGTHPVRNAMVNANLAEVVKRIGIDDAPGVAEFYVRHNKAFYVSQTHSTKFLAADCEGLRTQWANGRSVMHRDASETDRVAADGGMWGRIAARKTGEIA